MSSGTDTEPPSSRVPSPGALQTPTGGHRGPPPHSTRAMADAAQPPVPPSPQSRHGGGRLQEHALYWGLRVSTEQPLTAKRYRGNTTTSTTRHEQLHGDTDGAFPVPRDHAGLNPTAGAGIRDQIHQEELGSISPCQDPSHGARILKSMPGSIRRWDPSTHTRIHHMGPDASCSARIHHLGIRSLSPCQDPLGDASIHQPVPGSV